MEVFDWQACSSCSGYSVVRDYVQKDALADAGPLRFETCQWQGLIVKFVAAHGRTRARGFETWQWQCLFASCVGALWVTQVSSYDK